MEGLCAKIMKTQERQRKSASSAASRAGFQDFYTSALVVTRTGIQIPQQKYSKCLNISKEIRGCLNRKF